MVAVSAVGAIFAVLAVLYVDRSAIRVHSTDRAAGGGGRPADGSSSRPSKNNRHGGSQAPEPSDTDLRPSDLPEDAPSLRPISVEPETSLRDEAVMVDDGDGHPMPVYRLPEDARPDGDLLGRPVYRVLNEWRDWMQSYLSAHMEFEDPSGETVRTPLENSYMPSYANRYYARIKDFERGVKRYFGGDVTTAMLTFTASSVNDNGAPRCPADHMTEIRDGWRTCRKVLHKVLDGYEWEYVRIWEPHKSGYGHLHVGVFVHGVGLIEPETFGPVFESYVSNVEAAGTEAHRVEGDDAAISINENVENLGSYLSEYIGQYGEELTERSLEEQIFYATTWATNTRRVDFSNGAQEIIAFEEFRRETGLNPEDRGGGREAFERWRSDGSGGGGESSETARDGAQGDECDEGGGWSVSNVTYVQSRSRVQVDPTAGGVSMTAIDGRPGLDPPAKRS